MEIKYGDCCSICGREGCDWTAHLNEINKEVGFSLWERVEGGFMCGFCGKVFRKPTRFCSNCGVWYMGTLARTDEEFGDYSYLYKEISNLTILSYGIKNKKNYKGRR
jgi:hypothetical protein